MSASPRGAPLSALRLGRKVVSLLEQTSNGPLRIDRDQGIIYGVKVLGWASPNNPDGTDARQGTRYSADALRGAITLYENIDVKIDHRDRKSRSAERPVFTKIGKLRNVRLEADGLRADLHYLKTHQFSESICEDVERRLGLFGMSHDARGSGDTKNGTFFVESIVEVRSVDIVDQPATTANLWESRNHQQETNVKIRFAQLLESFAMRTRSRARKRVAYRLMEADYMQSDKPLPEEGDETGELLEEDPGAPLPVGDVPVDPLPPGDASSPDAHAALKDGFRAAIDSVLSDETMDAKAKLARIKELLVSMEKLTSDKEPMADDGGDMLAEETPIETPESRRLNREERAEYERLRRERKVITLCESLTFRPSETQLAAMVNLTESQQREFVAEAKQRRGSAPRSSAHPTFVGGGQKNITDAKSLLESLRK